MTDVVVDASAIIALLRREKGAEIVAGAISAAVVSAVNLAEVATWLLDSGVEDDRVRGALDRMELDVSPFDREAAFEAASLRQLTRDKGLSLGDRACLTLARQLGLPVLTADRRWAEVDVGVDVRLIR